jgi:hypothetical protein
MGGSSHRLEARRASVRNGPADVVTPISPDGLVALFQLLAPCPSQRVSPTADTSCGPTADTSCGRQV